MTRTQTRTYGVIAPSSRQLLLEAMLRVFACLASNVGSMCRTIFNRRNRDWHTGHADEDQRLSSNDITKKEPQPPQPSFSGKRDLSAEARRAQAEARIPGIPVASTQGTTPYSLAAHNQDARHKAEHDTVGAEPARYSLLSFRAKAHSAADPEPKSHTHHDHHVQLLGSRLRGNDSVGVRLIPA